MESYVADNSFSSLRARHASGAIDCATDAFHLVLGLVERSLLDEGLRTAEGLRDRFPLVGEAVATFAFAAPPFYQKPRSDVAEHWVAWMRVAAASEGEAAMLLGNYFVAVEDYSAARAAYEMGVAIGSAENAFAIGYLYASGDGVPLDLVRACEWFMRAGRMDWNGWLTTDHDAVPVGSDGVWRDPELLASYLSELDPEDGRRLLAATRPDRPWPQVVRSSGTPLLMRCLMYGQAPEFIVLDDGSTLLERGNALMSPN